MSAFNITRSLIIRRSPEEVFDTVVDYNTWTTWSPWLSIEPTARVTIQGDGRSLGSIYSWDGDVVGSGEIEHKRQNRPREIEDEIRFRKPFKSQSKIGFRVEPVSDGARLTWTMDGSLPWFLFWMKSNMETYVGQDYEHGLRKIRDRIEKGSVASRIEVKGVESIPAMTVVGIRDNCTIDDIGPSMSRACSQAKTAIVRGGLPTDGEMVCVYHHADLKRRQFDYTSGYTIPAVAASDLNGLNRCDLPAGSSLHLRHTGSYDHLGNAWSGAYAIARHKKLKLAKRDSFEVYRNDPATTPESEWITDIYIPVR
jgi:effector-binding domain-containing protein/uncharacterized protein YndB with AHSA1/START domain